METICIKCQILFSWKNKKNITNLSSAELAKTVVKLEETDTFSAEVTVFVSLQKRDLSTLKGNICSLREQILSF